MLEVVVKNLGNKKEQEELEQVLLEDQFGEVVVLHLHQEQEIMPRK